jgi:predicted dehydrogenase
MARKIGLIGAGARGETFARQLYEGVEDATLFGVCDINAERLKTFVDYCELKGAKTFTDPKVFLTHPEMDAVIITTPDFTHADVACTAMKAGKAVYLEKPLAPTIEECRRIIECQRATGAKAYVGFSNRQRDGFAKVRELAQNGTIGKLTHVQQVEQLSQSHSASFMRRFHRRTKHTGGLLNHKCSHDLDLMQWYVGHQNHVKRIACFASRSVFAAKPPPATHCHLCPKDIHAACPYKDVAGFVFPVRGKDPLHHPDRETYGGDLCAYTLDKDIFEDHTVILEWDHGVIGSFNLVLYQAKGRREVDVWGDNGRIHWIFGEPVRVTLSDSRETVEYSLDGANTADSGHKSGHGGSDGRMIRQFLKCINGTLDEPSLLEHGLAATLVAVKALESHRTSRVIEIAPEEYA